MQKTETIDGIVYTTRTLPATSGLVILPKLIALFGDSLLKMFFIPDKAKREALLKDPEVIATILYKVSQAAADEDRLLVLKDLLATTEADKVRLGVEDGTPTEIVGDISKHFDTHFQARYGHMFNVAMWVAQVNFIAP